MQQQEAERVPPPATSTELSHVLSDLSMAEYAPTLQAEGIDTVQDLLNLTKEDLIELGLKMGPRNRVLKWQQV